MHWDCVKSVPLIVSSQIATHVSSFLGATFHRIWWQIAARVNDFSVRRFSPTFHRLLNDSFRVLVIPSHFTLSVSREVSAFSLFKKMRLL